jgi:hypothetical protein
MMFREWLRAPVVAAVFVVAAGLLAPRRAQAQLLGTGGTGTLTGTGGSTGTTFTTDDIFVGVQAVPGVNLVPADAARFFNQEHCNCSTPITIFVALQSTGFAKRASVTTTTGNLSIVLGPECGSVLGQIIGQVSDCLVLGNVNILTFLNKGSFTVTTDARQLSTFLALTSVPDAGVNTTDCTSTLGQFPQTINAVFDFNGDSIVDLNVTDSLVIDLTPPPAPTGVTIQGGDEALVMNWTAIDTSLTTDLLGYQILCSRADQYQVFKESGTDGGANGPFNAGFLRCPQTQVGTGVEGLDPTFVCSPLLSADSTSYRVKILQNGITYAAAVVAVDNSGNPSVPIVGYGAPIKTLSFYDVYRNENPQDPGGASGGFCALATARPRLTSTLGGLLLFGLVGVGVAVARRRGGRR